MEALPRQEMEGRISKFQSNLEEMDLDGAFILQNTDLFYLSGRIQLKDIWRSEREYSRRNDGA